MMRVGVVVLLAGTALLAETVPGTDCRQMLHYGKRDQAKACFTRLAQSRSPWAQAEGLWGIGDFTGANNAYKRAVAVEPKNPEVRVRWGRLFLERFNPPDAENLFKEALEINENSASAYLGLALVAAEGYSSKAAEAAEKALKLDPKLVEAQELLAKVALEDNNPTKAVEQADAALKISPEALDALAVRASVELLADHSADQWFAKIAAVNPVYGEGYALAGHFFVMNRRYEEGIAMYRKALQLDPTLQSARSEMGINLMRLGLEKDAREALETAYNENYRSPATVNTLKLMDTYKDYVTFSTPTTIVRLHKKEADLLRPYVEGELKRAMATYEKKYGVKIKDPVQVEVYPNHPDFEVRTMGMPGLGALGVTFGHVVAMDSPSGRPPGQFHWASTLWHELSHVYVLTATNHRVPRWFTEGMAVHEETAASPDWGDRLDPQVIKAITDKKLLPVADLDRGFVHPSYPAQVIVSYFQAGRICDFINEKWGYSKLLDMMHDYAELKPTPEVVRRRLKLEPEEFDKQFLAWLDKQVRPTVDGYSEWQKTMKTLAAGASDQSPDDVIREGRQAISLYPEFVEGKSAYEVVADAFLKKDDKVNARKQLEQYASIGGRNPATLMKLANLQTEAGMKSDAMKTYERLIFIYPLGEEMHRKLGELYLEAGKNDGAVKEFAAAVAAKPTDEAGARFSLAKALFSAQRKEEAKEQLLLSLEIAPSFKPAQKLLLELSR